MTVTVVIREYAQPVEAELQLVRELVKRWQDCNGFDVTIAGLAIPGRIVDVHAYASTEGCLVSEFKIETT